MEAQSQPPSQLDLGAQFQSLRETIEGLKKELTNLDYEYGGRCIELEDRIRDNPSQHFDDINYLKIEAYKAQKHIENLNKRVTSLEKSSMGLSKQILNLSDGVRPNIS